MEEKIFTVREVTRLIKNIIEQGTGFLWVQGEISNFKAHSSGHFYFSLKDESSQLSCVMFRDENRKLELKPEDGMEVHAYGRIGVYEKQGVYQLYVYDMKPVGIGELARRFEALKKKLKSEGLFEKEYKKLLPDFPLKIGVVTASTGAAIQDILNILSRRAPYVEVILKPVKVQGKNAADEITQAINEFNKYGDVDLLIVGRGGGSIEDLWAFNEEKVARAIFNSEIPVISAVGHEIDFTISDFVADLRAPTPSAAAELAVRDKKEILESINNLLKTAGRLFFNNIEQKRERQKNLSKRYGIVRVVDTIRQKKQSVDEYERRIISKITYVFSMKSQMIEGISKRLGGLDPSAVLGRGYTITRRLPEMKIISTIKDIRLYDRLAIEFTDGITRAIIDKKNLQNKEDTGK
ncbi:exodeoxyribonuclease VII large subunit [candidate division WOR-3 bacterium]|nr:exodeoxyribonuclease VII large subunit [candidate division WOR-3 bacterium]